MAKWSILIIIIKEIYIKAMRYPFLSMNLPSFLPSFLPFLLRQGVVAAHRLSLVAVSRGYSLLRCMGFSLRWLLVAEHGLQACGLQQLQLAGSRAQAQQSWYTGLVAPQHVGSSCTRAQTHVPCTGRQSPNHCTTREVPVYEFLKSMITLNAREDVLNFTVIHCCLYCQLVSIYKETVIL